MTEQQGYISINAILEEVFDLFDNEELPFASLVRHASDALKLIGAENYMEDDNITISISNRKGTMPCGIQYINASRTVDGEPLRYASNNFQSDWHSSTSPDVGMNNTSLYTYSINGYNVFTDFDKDIIMNVRKMAVDDDGFPLIPADVKFRQAVKYYIASKIAEKMWLMEKISTEKFNHLEAERDWYIGAAISRSRMPSHDQLESISNQFARLIEQPLAHSNFFKGAGHQEILKNHPRA